MHDFFKQPILNSPYEYPSKHWKLDSTGQPTQQLENSRRKAEFVTPIPRARRKGAAQEPELALESPEQKYDIYGNINKVRAAVDEWRKRPEPLWNVTPETARLLKHWRGHEFSRMRPFFCQIEAVETIIWLTEAAAQTDSGKRILKELENASREANPLLLRTALKLATGAGKTTVMAMLIAWQTVNAARRPGSKLYTMAFLVVAPGLTIKDRLRVLLPNDPESYYRDRELVPVDMLDDIKRAKIVITNYHAFKLRDKMELSTGGRALLQGRHGEKLSTQESEGQMLQRVMPELLGFKNIFVLNDEAHHCYREKAALGADGGAEKLDAEEKEEAEKNNEAARLWISGIEALTLKLNRNGKDAVRVVDLSATPFFLRGSGYAEGTLFPWTVSDFSLMDAIESGIVKLPRVPIADNVPDGELPKFRDLWENIRNDMPKKGRATGGALDPDKLPVLLQSALGALYDHYQKTHDLWEKQGIPVPPSFIIVCQNTAVSKLVFDYVSGYKIKGADGREIHRPGKLPLFRNFDEAGNPLSRPKTLLIDSEQLEAGDALDKNFRAIASGEIEKFRRDIVERTGNADAAEKISDQQLLREVMNTVGKAGKLGGQIRCVVSVSMLTEGWDASTVTHILGIRAFGTQLLCEQVVGRALRRQSYELNGSGVFNAEYADIFGIPFTFTAKPVVAPPQPPRPIVLVRAVSPERDGLEITFPRLEGYRTETPDDALEADFSGENPFPLTPEMVGPTQTTNAGIIGDGVVMTPGYLQTVREATIVYHLTMRLMQKHLHDEEGGVQLPLFGQAKAIVREWLRRRLVCKGGTFPAQLLHTEIADAACDAINAAITRKRSETNPVKPVLSPYNPEGSTRHVHYTASPDKLWETAAGKSHVNHAFLDSEWEGEFCRVAEAHPKVLAYVKNHNLGLEVPYKMGGVSHRYIPDFILLVDDGRGREDPLHLLVEIKGYRGLDAVLKKETVETFWIPAVNNHGGFGRWAFAEFCDVWEMETDFANVLGGRFEEMLAKVP